MEEKNIVLYGNIDDGPVVAVVVENETLWLTQKQMAELFNCSSDNISLHLKNIFNSGELDPISTTEESSVVQTEGTRRISRTVKYYNLDAIIAVGYRVNSKQATHFRQWATQVLKEYIIKGFALDDDRLKQAKTVLGKDYLQELLERVRSIRASEQRIWLQVIQGMQHRLRQSFIGSKTLFCNCSEPFSLCHQQSNCRRDYSCQSRPHEATHGFENVV